MARTKPYELIHEDNELLVVNKSAGVVTIADRGGEIVNLQDLLRSRYGEVYAVHRLDKDTSGIVVYARTAEMHRHISMLFEHRKMTKTYQAIVWGVPSIEEGVIDVPLRVNSRGKVVVDAAGKPSRSLFRVLQSFNGYSFLELRAETGRQHQLRVHLAYMGNPLVVDPLYGSPDPLYIHKIKPRASGQTSVPLLHRTPLHAASLRWDDDVERKFEASLPKDMRATLNQLERWRSLR